MPFQHLLVIYLIGTLLVFLPSFGLARLFQKAGVPAWKAYIPFYNTWVMQEIGQRPKHWVFWQFIPVAGWFISMGIFIEFVKLFGKFSFGQHTMASLLAPIYFPVLAAQKNLRYSGPEAVKNYKKAGWREWVDAAIFAIVAATLIRLFVFEAYTIPTPSMEKSLLVNDFLFVSKLSYGPRVPNTPLSVPFIHNYLPASKRKSYLEWIKIPYIRWFAAPVKRGDAVVFNFPAGDTVINHKDFQSARPYYELKRWMVNGSPEQKSFAQMVFNDPEAFPIAVHPVDKTDNYIKRCVGIPGDTLSIKDGLVYINGQKQELAPDAQMNYIVTIKGNSYLDPDIMKEEYNLDAEKYDYRLVSAPNVYHMLLTEKARQKMTKAGLIQDIKLDYSGGDEPTFPYDTLHHYSRDNFGPIWIPKKNATITLTPENFAVYERAIGHYEHNDLRREGNTIYINGQATNQYTFKMDYYWMMGDNRMGSQDSRYWGFVPEDHVVGKAWMIWFSFEKGKGPRWNRFFKMVR
ncbi:MAG: signal peptidase I [Chitinophagaceae bacterium]|nr:signal peptidase I [Chitinophagaceae bacterium]